MSYVLGQYPSILTCFGSRFEPYYWNDVFVNKKENYLYLKAFSWWGICLKLKFLIFSIFPIFSYISSIFFWILYILHFINYSGASVPLFLWYFCPFNFTSTSNSFLHTFKKKTILDSHIFPFCWIYLENQMCNFYFECFYFPLHGACDSFQNRNEYLNVFMIS